MEKKTEIITIRLSKSTKEELRIYAEKKEWSISKAAEKIITTYLQAEDDEKSRTP